MKEKLFKIEDGKDYMEAYKELAKTTLFQKTLWKNLDDIIFHKIAAALQSSKPNVSRGAMVFILEQAKAGKIQLTDEQLKNFILRTTDDNLEAIVKIEELRGRNVNKPENKTDDKADGI